MSSCRSLLCCLFFVVFFFFRRLPPTSTNTTTLFPSPTLFRSPLDQRRQPGIHRGVDDPDPHRADQVLGVAHATPELGGEAHDPLGVLARVVARRQIGRAHV